MAQEEGKAQLLKEKFPFIDIIFGTHNVAELGALIDTLREKRKSRSPSFPNERRRKITSRPSARAIPTPG